MKMWRDDRDIVLAEFLRLDGRGDYADQTTCACCESETEQPCYRCEDCVGGELLCKNCIVDIHAMMPLHRIEVRDYLFFSLIFFNLFTNISLSAALERRLIREDPAEGPRFTRSTRTRCA